MAYMNCAVCQSQAPDGLVPATASTGASPAGSEPADVGASDGLPEPDWIIIDDVDAVGNHKPLRMDPEGPLYRQKIERFVPNNIYLKVTLPTTYDASKEYVVTGDFTVSFAGKSFAELVNP